MPKLIPTHASVAKADRKLGTTVTDDGYWNPAGPRVPLSTLIGKSFESKPQICLTPGPTKRGLVAQPEHHAQTTPGHTIRRRPMA
jgi:hypothetical protein